MRFVYRRNRVSEFLVKRTRRSDENLTAVDIETSRDFGTDEGLKKNH